MKSAVNPFNPRLSLSRSLLAVVSKLPSVCRSDAVCVCVRVCVVCVFQRYVCTYELMTARSGVCIFMHICMHVCGAV